MHQKKSLADWQDLDVVLTIRTNFNRFYLIMLMASNAINKIPSTSFFLFSICMITAFIYEDLLY